MTPPLSTMPSLSTAQPSLVAQPLSKAQPLPIKQATVEWKEGGDGHLRGVHGAGSQSAIERQQRSKRESQLQASQCYSIKAMFQRQMTMPKRLSKKEQLAQLGVFVGESTQASLNSIEPLTPACLPPMNKKETLKKLQEEALETMNRLLNLVTEQEKKYGCRLAPQSNFYQRHLMVKHFLAIQTRRTPDQTR